MGKYFNNAIEKVDIYNVKQFDVSRTKNWK